MKDNAKIVFDIKIMTKMVLELGWFLKKRMMILSILNGWLTHMINSFTSFASPSSMLLSVSLYDGDCSPVDIT